MVNTENHTAINQIEVLSSRIQLTHRFLLFWFLLFYFIFFRLEKGHTKIVIWGKFLSPICLFHLAWVIETSLGKSKHLARMPLRWKVEQTFGEIRISVPAFATFSSEVCVAMGMETARRAAISKSLWNSVNLWAPRKKGGIGLVTDPWGILGRFCCQTL